MAISLPSMRFLNSQRLAVGVLKCHMAATILLDDAVDDISLKMLVFVHLTFLFMPLQKSAYHPHRNLAAVGDEDFGEFSQLHCTELTVIF
jgi:hypothetical protein